MNRDELSQFASRFLDAWNIQDVEKVLACYTENLIYLDPNTSGAVQGAESMRRYLTRLFARWQMHWSLKEGFPLQEQNGAGILWHATFQKKGSKKIIEADGMDLVLLEGDRIKRNEVYFDRMVLLPLMGMAGRIVSSFSSLGRRQRRKTR